MYWRLYKTLKHEYITIHNNYDIGLNGNAINVNVNNF